MSTSPSKHAPIFAAWIRSNLKIRLKIMSMDLEKNPYGESYGPFQYIVNWFLICHPTITLRVWRRVFLVELRKAKTEFQQQDANEIAARNQYLATHHTYPEFYA